MTAYLTAFAVSLLYVGLRSFQQLNVQHSQYWWIPPISMAMAFSDFYLINQMVKQTGWIAVAIGLGGGIGAVTSVYIHSRLRRRKEQSK